MRALEAVSRALAAVEGDPEELIEVPTKDGLTRVPAWKVYRVRGRVALDAARNAICEAMFDRLNDRLDEEDGLPGLGEFLAAWDDLCAP